MGVRDEQETTVTLGRNDEWVYIWSNNPVHVRKLEKDTRAIKETSNSDEVGGFYTVSTDDFNVVGGFKRRVTMTDEQRKAAAERLQKVREAQ